MDIVSQVLKFKLKMKLIIKVILFLVLVVSFFVYFYTRNKFNSGECVQALDGYIWHVNNYSFRKYSLMGWQDNAWGNEIKMKKDVLERKEISGIPTYHQIVCPEYSPN